MTGPRIPLLGPENRRTWAPCRCVPSRRPPWPVERNDVCAARPRSKKKYRASCPNFIVFLCVVPPATPLCVSAVNYGREKHQPPETREAEGAENFQLGQQPGESLSLVLIPMRPPRICLARLKGPLRVEVPSHVLLKEQKSTMVSKRAVISNKLFLAAPPLCFIFSPHPLGFFFAPEGSFVTIGTAFSVSEHRATKSVIHSQNYKKVTGSFSRWPARVKGCQFGAQGASESRFLPRTRIRANPYW